MNNNNLKCEERKVILNQKERFVLMQGTFTNLGTGDEWTVFTYDNYEDAKQDFESLKTKIKGIVRYANGYIETWILRQVWNEEEEEWELPEDGFDCVDSYRVNINSFGLAEISENE